MRQMGQLRQEELTGEKAVIFPVFRSFGRKLIQGKNAFVLQLGSKILPRNLQDAPKRIFFVPSCFFNFFSYICSLIRGIVLLKNSLYDY